MAGWAAVQKRSKNLRPDPPGTRFLSGLFAALSILVLFTGATGWAQQLPTAAEYYEQSLSLYKEGNFFESLMKARKAVESAPDEADYQHLLGMIYFALGQNTDAGKNLHEAIELDPDKPQYYYDLSLVYLKQHRLDLAKEYLEKTIEFMPDFAMAYLLLGRVIHNQNLTETALTYFEKARELDPELRSLHFHIGFAYKAMGQNDKAIVEMEKEAQLHPDYLPARIEAGELQLKASNPEAAVGHLRYAAAHDAENPTIQFQLGKALFELKEYDPALEALQEASRLDPMMSEPYYLMAQVYMKLGKRKEAQEQLALFKKVKKPK
jgi:tetratricopeptide (TPR) repeat protein